MAAYVVDELNGNAVFRHTKIDASSAIEAAMSATGRTVASGREPGKIWIRVTDECGHTTEYH
ncbi:hypothetical protein [Mesorhizobium cantuariense]|uniref:Uncharacterized protein n=1 Tax=Mesorhizobium cantuariense TaxID=1300275 RepID=A0ABV7MYD3_9HYPH